MRVGDKMVLGTSHGEGKVFEFEVGSICEDS